MNFSFAGNERVITALQALIGEHRLPHAILIAGEKGTGRHTLANFTANAAVCSDDNAPCGRCRACEVFKSGNHPDVIRVMPLDNKKSISVSQARDIRNQAFVKSHMGGRKVFIIDSADTIPEQSQNTLLKILEEPPQNVCFILIAENSASLLETIISRCVLFELSVPSIEQAESYISKTTDYDMPDIKAAVASAKANIGSALEILSGNSGGPEIAAAQEFADKLFENRSAYELLKTVYPIEKNRKECEAFIKQLKTIISKKITSQKNSEFALKRLFKYYSVICDAEPALITNINLSLFLSSLVCALSQSS